MEITALFLVPIFKNQGMKFSAIYTGPKQTALLWTQERIPPELEDLGVNMGLD